MSDLSLRFVQERQRSSPDEYPEGMSLGLSNCLKSVFRTRVKSICFVGDKVEAFDSNNDGYSPATIMNPNPRAPASIRGKFYTVRWKDGAMSNISPRYVRARRQKSSPSASARERNLNGALKFLDGFYSSVTDSYELQ